MLNEVSILYQKFQFRFQKCDRNFDYDQKYDFHQNCNLLTGIYILGRNFDFLTKIDFRPSVPKPVGLKGFSGIICFLDRLFSFFFQFSFIFNFHFFFNFYEIFDNFLEKFRIKKFFEKFRVKQFRVE